MTTARIVYIDPIDTSELIVVDGHRLQYGGVGDGYCYVHQSFDCLDGLTAEQRLAVNNADYEGPEDE